MGLDWRSSERNHMIYYMRIPLLRNGGGAAIGRLASRWRSWRIRSFCSRSRRSMVPFDAPNPLSEPRPTIGLESVALGGLIHWPAADGASEEGLVRLRVILFVAMPGGESPVIGAAGKAIPPVIREASGSIGIRARSG